MFPQNAFGTSIVPELRPCMQLFSEENIDFQKRIVERSGLGDETGITDGASSPCLQSRYVHGVQKIFAFDRSDDFLELHLLTCACHAIASITLFFSLE